MKLTAVFLAILFTISACSAQKVESQKTNDSKKVEDQKPETEDRNKKFVLVELFTSEGCSSCPPADKVLARLQKEQPVENVEIVPLSLHVDYWNYLGWKDEFSSSAFSARQNGYAEKFKIDAIYTPQMVVDGEKQFVGSQFETAVNSVRETSKIKKSDVRISLENDKVKIDVSDLPAHDAAYVWFVIAEDDLQTNVKRGENSGRKLPHAAVAREMKLLETLPGNAKNFNSAQMLAFKPNWKKENLSIIVFVQGKDSKKIFAVGKKRLV